LSCTAHGRGGDRPSRRHFYPGSTMTDGQFTAALREAFPTITLVWADAW
jgi:hypothetical protein